MGLNYGNRSEPDGDFEDRNAIEAVSEAKRPVTKVEEMMTFSLSTTSIHHWKLSNPRCLSHFFVLAIMNL
ncbi:hypothetical protein Prudu_020689 [Prunus dulcis]|uniref:Uncharacterized protein n=1 Tax=Prunus dulcis TaxID=3755 RepID=A0A4Y1RXM7_PRUDU|nr:hypothetical protein Prudu_020689 [Prunus dulcis]